MTDVSSYGAWLATARHEQHQTLRQLGSTVGVNASFLSDVEHDRKKVSFEVAVRVCKALDYEPWSVLEWFEIMPPDVYEYLTTHQPVREGEA